ncbi:hydroxymethylglutaryl-CoA lyase [Bermanella sp. WJH001]|uniref:hydroxymethylglutaryl-CoA lyase n=1 Tax=Bermanella sp. WJH001 TaxID=3048005 RepID=UPI0024BE4D4E|nr:hydroxymethylglutaryl-CoA lyase [Bermanella sp. WJH001]MDJ1539863.1 hydroxymethylglutaryl-CoA lyase [Bermanella sp. WJH001]
MTIPNKVHIIEVGPRDGLQNEKQTLPVALRVELIERLAKAGLKKIEAGSFVSPKWVPQMANTDQVLTALNASSVKSETGAQYAVLTPNLKGLEGAVQNKADEIAIFGAASEAFTQKNINCSIKESLQRFEDIAASAQQLNLPMRGYVSTIISCPYQGDIDPQAVADVAKTLYQMGCFEISLGDTIGVGTPIKFKRMLDAVLKEVPADKIAVHCHNTYGQALVNIYASLEYGINKIDSAVAGLGGCPYAKGASGNIATEDVLYMLHGMNIETGINLDEVIKIGNWICRELKRDNQSKVGLALSS